MHILVIDSDPIQIQSLARGLKGEGFSVSTATTGTEAVAALEKNAPDIGLILVDLKVPHLDPFTLPANTRNAHNLFPVIIMTTYISKELQEKIQCRKNMALIEKPFVLEELVREIAKFKIFQPSRRAAN